MGKFGLKVLFLCHFFLSTVAAAAKSFELNESLLLRGPPLDNKHNENIQLINLADTSVAPTRAPTAAVLYEFFVDQIILGITLTNYNTNTSANNAAILNILADGLTHIETPEIEMLSVETYSSRRMLIEKYLANSLQIAVETSHINSLSTGVTISYRVEYDVFNYGTSTSAAYTILKTELVTFITSGNFATSLNTYCLTASNYCPYLQTVTSTSVKVGSYSASNRIEDDTNDDKELDIPLIVGLCVGLGGGFLIVIFILVWFLRTKAKKVHIRRNSTVKSIKVSSKYAVAAADTQEIVSESKTQSTGK